MTKHGHHGRCTVCGSRLSNRYASSGSGVYRILACTQNPYHRQPKPERQEIPA